MADLRVLTDTLASRLNGAIRPNSPIRGVDRTTEGWRVYSPTGTESYGSLLFCSPAHRFPALEAHPATES